MSQSPKQTTAARGYDALTTEHVLAHLGELTQADLAKLANHERAHQNRAAVLTGIEARLGEPWSGYDALDVSDVRSALDHAGHDTLVTVLDYERAHRNRAGVLLAIQQHLAQD